MAQDLAELRIALLNNVEFDEECWTWTGRRNLGGYGTFRWRGKYRSAHRLSYEAFNGRDPGLYLVRHKCDTPWCINPDHLELGTWSDNAKDMAARGRCAFQRKRA